mgnify:CR=1 FL=1
MAKCSDCGLEMLEATSCTATHLVFTPRQPLEGKTAATIYPRDTTYYDSGPRCHDCGIVNTPCHVHHYECDIERCPKCGGQLLSCGCREEFIITPAALAEAKP